MWTAALALTLLTSPAAVIPQQPLRALAGRVLDGSGEPVAGARVFLLHRPLPILVAAEREERREARTDAAGLFRVEVRDGRDHSVWARWDQGATEIEDGVQAGTFVVLRADPRAAPATLRVLGAEAWAERGPLRYEVLAGGEQADFVPIVAEDGSLRVPPLPGCDFRVLRVRTADGALLRCERLEPGEAELQIPPPFEFEVRVRDAAGGGAVAGAEVRFHLLNHWLNASPRFPGMERFDALWPLAGRTDAEGRLRARVCIWRPEGATQPPALRLLVRAEGREGAAVARLAAGPTGSQAAAEQPVVEVALAGAEPLALQVLDGGERVRTGALRLTWRIQVESEQGRIGLPFVETLDLAGDAGAAGLRIARRMPAEAVIESAWLELSERQRAARTGDGEVAAPSWERLLVEGPVLRLPEAGDTVVQLTTPDGQPAARAMVWLTAVDPRGRAEAVRAMRADRRGRVLVDLRDREVLDGALRLCAVGPAGPRGDGGMAFGVRALEPEAIRAGEVVHLGLEAMPTVPVRVVDGAGAPVPQARVAVASYAPSGEEVGADGLHLVERGLIVHALAAVLTDAAGRARLPMLQGLARLALVAAEGPRRGRQQFVGNGGESGELVIALGGS
jgi:hypothetical protein